MLAFLVLGVPVAGTAEGRQPAPSLLTNHQCYRVGEPVRLTGSGFALSRAYAVTIDGVYFGQSTTDAKGGFKASLLPGGLAAGVVQHVDHLQASDGTSSARTTFTLTRDAGARFLARSGDPNTLEAPFEVWGFALNGSVRRVYLHYVSPRGRPRETVSLGRTGGQCGYLRTGRRHFFPFTPSSGTWTLQVDTKSSYIRHPGGPVARIRVVIS